MIVTYITANTITVVDKYRQPIDISQVSWDYRVSWNTIATNRWIFTQPILPRTSTRIVHKQITLQSIRAQITFQSAKQVALRNSYHHTIDKSLVSKDHSLCDQYCQPMDILTMTKDYRHWEKCNCRMIVTYITANTITVVDKYRQPIDISQVSWDYRVSWNTIATYG